MMFMSNGYKAVFDDLSRSCEKSIGHTVTAQSGTSTSLTQRITAGEPFDVAIMTTEAMEDPARQGTSARERRLALRHWYRRSGGREEA